MPIFPMKVHAADKSDTANVTQGHVLKSINTDAHQCEYILCHKTIHFKMVKTVHFMLYIFYHKKISHVKKVKSLSRCLTLWDPMDWTPWDCSLPGSSLHGILQARILEGVAISFSRESS